uniref:Protein IQ-DOMAIN 1 n=1 Tax=Triticum urartu TaxID=4572 RepID=A0A8R7VED1_TRIUA
MSVPSELLLSIPPCMNIWRVRVTRELLISICPMYKYLSIQARRALRALKGLVRLKSLVQGHSVKRQATSTLRCMQTLSRVQSKIWTRRIKMAEENQALQRQLLLNQELETLR